MKKINNIVLLTAALAASLACQKTEINEQRPQSEGRFTVLVTTEEISTRTAFGTLSGDNKYPTLWQADDKVKFSLNNAEGVSATAEVVGGGTTATFSPSFTEAEAADYTIYAVSPASAAVSFAENSISVNIPSVQTPGKSSCDPAAQLLYAKSETSTAKPAEFKARFKHLTSYLKITLSNLPAGVTPAKLKLDLSSPAAGTFSYNASDNTLTAKESAVTALEASVSSNEVWFACAPVDLSGKSVPVKMTSDNGTAYVKTISFPEGRQMEAGKVYGIDINMSDAVVPYQKTITPGDEGFSTNGKIEGGLMQGLNYWEKGVKGTYKFSDVPVGGKYDIVLRVYYFEGWTSQLTSLSIKINDRAEESYFVTAVNGVSVKGESYITLKDVELNAGENEIVVGNGACHKGWQDMDKFFAQAGWMMVTNSANDYVQSEKVIKVSLTPGQPGVEAIGGANIDGSFVKGIWFWDDRFGKYTFENVPAGTYNINVKVNWWVDNVEVSTGIRVNGGDRLSEKVVKTTTSVTFKNVELQEGTNVIKVGRGEYGPATADKCKFYPEVGTVTITNY